MNPIYLSVRFSPLSKKVSQKRRNTCDVMRRMPKDAKIKFCTNEDNIYF
jgi:hypothetical protein